jgi:tRNA pseudouridine55 synthase
LINGILLIDKQEGITSYDVIRKLKRLLPRKYKIGHAGTLDPFATGLLVILLGKGTKLMNTFHTYTKEYEVVAEFGFEMDTQDPTGQVIGTDDKVISKAAIESVLPLFTGEIEQMPPKFSAKKINGKKAYELAREGKKVELKPKLVTISNLDLTNYDWPRVTFKCSVSAGTYIRTLVVDMAKELDTVATAVELKRTKIGEYVLENSLSSEKIEENDFESLSKLVIGI